MSSSGPLQAAMYYARKRLRAAKALSISMQPIQASILHQTLAADTLVSSVANIVDQRKGSNSLGLSGANAASFVLSGFDLKAKSGTVLVAGTSLIVLITVTNTVLGTASVSFTLTVT